MPDRLEDLHRRIDDLTTPNGDYAVVCPHSGERPVPVMGRSFATPADAEDAVDLVREYRETLRDVDPYLERVHLTAVETAADPLRLDVAREREERERNRFGRTSHDRRAGRVGGRKKSGKPTRSVTISGGGDEEWLRMDDAPVVQVREDGQPLDDAAIELQLNVKLR